MSTESERIEELKRGHAAQLDRLLEENARLRRALEGEIDPALFGATSLPAGRIRRWARRIVPKRFHPAISKAMKNLKP